MITLFLSSIIALILLVWFNSDAIVDWGKLFGLSNFLKIDEFYKMRATYVPAQFSYPVFLKNKYDNFFTKLIACKLCLSIWISFVFSWVVALLFLSPIMVLLMPITTILSLILYGIVNLLIR